MEIIQSLGNFKKCTIELFMGDLWMENILTHRVDSRYFWNVCISTFMCYKQREEHANSCFVSNLIANLVGCGKINDKCKAFKSGLSHKTNWKNLIKHQTEEYFIRLMKDFSHSEWNEMVLRDIFLHFSQKCSHIMCGNAWFLSQESLSQLMNDSTTFIFSLLSFGIWSVDGANVDELT